MKTFKNLKTGLVEVVSNKVIIEQYEKYPDVYVEVKASNNKGAEKTEKTGKAEKSGEKPASNNKGAEKTETVETSETPVEEPKAE